MFTLSFSPLLSTVALSFLGTILFFFLTRAVSALRSPLKTLPGPFVARFTRLWYLRSVWRGDFQETNRKLHERYGPIVRIAPNQYIIDDPDAVRLIYGSGSNFIKAPWYYASGRPGVHSGSGHEAVDLFTDRDAKRHAFNRRKVASMYSTTNLMKMEPCVSECTALLVERFHEIARTGKVIDMQHYLQCYAFDVIGLITVGKRFGLLDEGKDHFGIFKSIHQYLIYCANVGVYSEWHDMVSYVLTKIGRRGANHVIKFTEEQIQQRLAKSSEGEKIGMVDDFLGRGLQMHRQAPETFSMENVRILCTMNIGAGSDTTSISLAGILYHLTRSETALEKLRVEIDIKAANNEISNPVTFAEAQKMPYLQAVIKEGLRIHPVTGLPLARVVPSGGANISDVCFPQGTVVGINTWVAHVNKNIFGNDAHMFRPERWLEDEAQLSVMERYFLPFGHGSRTCIGKNISLMEISKLIPQLVRMFDFEITHPAGQLKLENVWFVRQTNFNCRVRLRAGLKSI